MYLPEMDGDQLIAGVASMFIMALCPCDRLEDGIDVSLNLLLSTWRHIYVQYSFWLRIQPMSDQILTFW